MSLVAFGIVLFSAVLHAGWNSIIKGIGGSTGLTTTLVVLFAGLLSAVILPFVPQPAPESWGFIALSTTIHVAYFSLVAGAYAAADMSQVYPLMRGFAPLLVAGVSTVALRENPGLVGWAGIALISGGVLSLALRNGLANGRGMAMAFANAFVICAYTLVDGTGVRLSGAAAGYTLWLNLLTAFPFVGWALLRHRETFLPFARRYAGLGLVGGFATLAAYGLALWAMTEAPIAMVAALRETSILFGTVIAALILKEAIDRPRIIATVLIAAGAIVLRLA